MAWVGFLVALGKISAEGDILVHEESPLQRQVLSKPDDSLKPENATNICYLPGPKTSETYLKFASLQTCTRKPHQED